MKWIKLSGKTKIFTLRRKVLAAIACACAAVAMLFVVNSPTVVGASATSRQLPIYCVQKDYKVLSISFDAAWGDVCLRRGSRFARTPAFLPQKSSRVEISAIFRQKFSVYLYKIRD